MRSSQNLDIRQSQNLVMTPQLQQAIKLLQMTNLELQEFVQQEMDNNPLIEEISSSEPFDQKEELLNREQERLSKITENLNRDEYDNQYSDYGSDKSHHDTAEQNFEQLKSYQDFSGSHEDFSDERNSAFASEEHLQDSLSMQLQIQKTSYLQGLIGSYLIGSLDEAGYIRESTKEIAGKLMVPELRVLEALKLCQSFEPAGIFARNLSECFALQLKEKNLLSSSFKILLENLPLLAQRDYKTIFKLCSIDKSQLSDMMQILKTLNPRPASSFHKGNVQLVIPDVIIEERENGGWILELNQSTLPKIAMNHRYIVELDQYGDEETRNFVKEKQYRASWLLRSLEQRSDTILRVCSEILRQQDAFFAYGIAHLRPMNLKLVAQELGLHESTISRVTSGKYMRCPKGIFELKYFFMSGVSGDDGGNIVASESIKHAIKKLIDAETVKNILSDEEIVALLKTQEIHLARRTVTKYREAMNIPSSVHRRRSKKSL